MAEYIDREKAIESLNAKINFSIQSAIDFTLYKREIQEIINNIYLSQMKEIKAIKSADVVERSKIDAAIEEIKAIQKEDIECDGSSDMGMVLDIIYKHLGGEGNNG